MPKTQQPAVVGRTPWDAAVEVASLLGKLTPWIIVAAGVLWAFYKFQEQSNQFQQSLSKAQRETQEQFMADLQAARDALVKTYADIGDLSNQQLDNVRDLLKLNEDVTARLEEQRNSLDQLQQEVEHQQALAVEQVRLAEDAQRAADEAQELKQRTDAERSRLEAELAANRAKLAELTGEVETKVAGLNQRAASIDALRAELEQLVQAVLAAEIESIEPAANGVSVDTALPPSAVLEIARRINAEILQDPAEILRAHATALTPTTRDDLSKLVGVTENTLADLVAEDLGHELWLRCADIDDGVEFFVGVTRQEPEYYAGVILLEFGDGRVTNVLTVDQMPAMRVQNDRDWNKFDGVIALSSEPNLTETFEISANSTEWSLQSDLLGTFFDQIDVLFGETRSVKLLSVEEFAEFSPDTYAMWMNDAPDWPPRLNIEMYARSKVFSAADLPGMTQPMPDDLRNALIAVLDAAVTQNAAVAALLPGSPTEANGRLAATALRESFKIIAVNFPDLPQTSPQKAQGQVTPQDTQSRPRELTAPLQAIVDAEYKPYAYGGAVPIRLSFTRADPNTLWQFAGWTDAELATAE
jgi:predicted  nucleic acid-binding Zn-ribbon protein